jgi:hypothetical protein
MLGEAEGSERLGEETDDEEDRTLSVASNIHTPWNEAPASLLGWQATKPKTTISSSFSPDLR